MRPGGVLERSALGRSVQGKDMIQRRHARAL